MCARKRCPLLWSLRSIACTPNCDREFRAFPDSLVFGILTASSFDFSLLSKHEHETTRAESSSSTFSDSFRADMKSKRVLRTAASQASILALRRWTGIDCKHVCKAVRDCVSLNFAFDIRSSREVFLLFAFLSAFASSSFLLLETFRFRASLGLPFGLPFASCFSLVAWRESTSKACTTKRKASAEPFGLSGWAAKAARLYAERSVWKSASSDTPRMEQRWETLRVIGKIMRSFCKSPQKSWTSKLPKGQAPIFCFLWKTLAPTVKGTFISWRDLSSDWTHFTHWHLYQTNGLFISHRLRINSLSIYCLDMLLKDCEELWACFRAEGSAAPTATGLVHKEILGPEKNSNFPKSKNSTAVPGWFELWDPCHSSQGPLGFRSLSRGRPLPGNFQKVSFQLGRSQAKWMDDPSSWKHQAMIAIIPSHQICFAKQFGHLWNHACSHMSNNVTSTSGAAAQQAF